MSYGGNADPSGIQVTFLDQTGAKTVKAVIAFSVPVSRIIPNIITKMSLPATSPDGQPMSYSLDHKEGGRRLLESWTLVEANVRDGDHLIVYPEVVAGRGSVKARSAEARIVWAVANRSGHAVLSTHQDALIATQGTLKAMHQSPRIRRLHSDLAALERLRSESSVFRFTATGDPPQLYRINFSGKGLWRDDRGRVRAHEQHHVVITLGASYPRSMPEIRWSSKIFHPNISEIGMVCLGGYGTHWVPSVQLDELCVMLWDMVRYHNYDIRSPYNRESALWVAGQTEFRFPTDSRPLRDLRAMQGRDRAVPAGHPAKDLAPKRSSRSKSGNNTPVSLVFQFIERYGRGSGDAPSGESKRRNFTEVMARMYPDRTDPLQIAEHSSDLVPKADVPEPLRREVVSEGIDSSVDRNKPAAASPPPTAGHSDSDAVPNDMMILEASPDDVRHETPRQGDDEVIFIT